MNEFNYVMAFITKKDLPLNDFSGGQEWLMVKHKIRGWELPGGKINDNENYEQAIIREVFEESGMNAYVRENPQMYGNGLVFWMGISSEHEVNLSHEKDPIISEIKWFSTPPKNLAWGPEELQIIIDLFK